jgi:polyhydroxyalkanoate synthesis regulator phasin
MQSAALIKQIMDINKKAFENSFDVMVAVQEHAEKMVNDFWKKSSYFPEDGKKVIVDWVDHQKTSLKEYRDHVDRKFRLVEEYLLNSVNQMESSFNSVIQKTALAEKEKHHPVPAKKAEISVKKTVAVKKGVVPKKTAGKKK